MFDIKLFKAGKIAVLCTTEEQVRAFFKIVGDAGLKWRGGDDPREASLYDYNRDYSECLGGNVYVYGYISPDDAMSRGSLRWFKDDTLCRRYQLVEFKEVPIKIESDDVLSILAGDI